MTGKGRGRGWLNIPKNSQRPGGTPTAVNTTSSSRSKDSERHWLDELFESGFTKDVSNASGSFHVPSSYAKIYAEIETLCDGDNEKEHINKIKQILTRMQSEWKTEQEIRNATICMLKLCLIERNFIIPVLKFFKHITFEHPGYNVNGICLRTIFLSILQRLFEDRERIEDVKTLINAIMLTMALLINFCVLTKSIILKTFLFYSIALVKPINYECYHIFTHLLYDYGEIIMDIIGSYKEKDDFDKFLGNIKTNIATCNDVNARYWLLFSLDIWNNNLMEPLPANIISYYGENLGEENMTHFKEPRIYKAASIIHANEYKMEALSLDTSIKTNRYDRYASDVNVLQIDQIENKSPQEQFAAETLSVVSNDSRQSIITTNDIRSGIIATSESRQGIHTNDGQDLMQSEPNVVDQQQQQQISPQQQPNNMEQHNNWQGGDKQQWRQSRTPQPQIEQQLNDVTITHKQQSHQQVHQQSHQHKNKQQQQHGGGGRAILGSGARYNKNKISPGNRQHQEIDGDNDRKLIGNDKDGSNNDWGQSHQQQRPKSRHSSKGWQHDDRFDIDYNRDSVTDSTQNSVVSAGGNSTWRE